MFGKRKCSEKFANLQTLFFGKIFKSRNVMDKTETAPSAGLLKLSDSQDLGV